MLAFQRCPPRAAAAFARCVWNSRNKEAVDCSGGGLEDFAKAGGFLAAADALLLRLEGKKVLAEGNNAFGGSGSAILPQDYSRQTQD